MAFPAVLTHLGLHAFDFCKVIESFVKHEPRLPHHLKLHFAEVEAKIVESLAWQDGSPLHGLMSEYDAALAAAATKALENGAAAADAPPAPNTRAKAALEQFVKKCLYLGAKRIQDLCVRLLLPHALVQQVWSVVKLVLDKARFLLVGRHLDQLLMCAVYGVCKVSARPVTFRQIIEQYRRQPGASPRTFREVRMQSAADAPQDIIQFYNLIFIPVMKDHLLRINGAANTAANGGANGANGAPGGASPAPAAPPADGDAAAPGPTAISPDLSTARGGASPRHVTGAGGRDVYVSSCTPNAHLTPRTRTLYAFSDTPAANGEFARINRSINGPPNPVGAAGGGSALDVLSSTAANGGSPAPPSAVAAAGHSARGELHLGGGGGGVMASGHKRSRAAALGLGEPARSGSSAANSEADDA